MNLRKPTPPGLPLSGEELSLPPDKGGLRGLVLRCYSVVNLTLQKSTFNLEMELHSSQRLRLQIAQRHICKEDALRLSTPIIAVLISDY